MKTISEAPAGRLVVESRTPWARWAVAGLLGCLGLAALELLGGRPPGDDRIVGLAGAAATLALMLAAFWECTRFELDPVRRLVRWSRRRAFKAAGGELGFDAVRAVVLQPVPGADPDAPRQRVALITDDGELPVTTPCEADDVNEAIARRMRAVLAMPARGLLDDGVRALLESGRRAEAVMLLRDRHGVPLALARGIVDRFSGSRG